MKPQAYKSSASTAEWILIVIVAPLVLLALMLVEVWP